MFTAIKPAGPLPPVPTTADPLSETGFAAWQYPEFPSPRLQVLIIDLVDRDIWDYCAAIMQTCRDLKELGFAGTPKATNLVLRAKKYSNFRRACSEFCGDTFRLKNVHFTDKSLPILGVVRGSRVTALVVQNCTYDTRWNSHYDLPHPFWPALKRVSFTGSSSALFKPRTRTPLLTLFFQQPIQHFELAAGCDPDSEIVRDCYWLECRHKILQMLRKYLQSSLKMFLEKDEVSGAYVQRDLLKEWELSDQRELVYSHLGWRFA
jgi:hypothetical protein